MKKTTIALAVLSAMSFSALAGNVTIYGVADAGLDYSHVKTDGMSAKNQFEMKSGQQSGSRVGIRGTEQLCDDVTVGFIIEGGFDLDTGKSTQSDRVFNRETNLFVVTPVGELSMGRVGGVGGANGSYGLLGMFSPFGSTWGSYAANVSNYMINADRFDNTITYRTPQMAGFQITAQYSFKVSSNQNDPHYTEGREGSSDSNRYMALGTTYTNGGLQLAMIVDSMQYSDKLSLADSNSISASIGGSYDFDVVKPYIGVQYFDKAARGLITGKIDSANPDASFEAMEGFGITTGVDIPMGGGVAKVGGAYVKAKQVDQKDNKFDRIGATIGYDYNLSQRTNLYAATSYMKTSYEFGDKVDQKAVEVLAGIRHTF